VAAICFWILAIVFICCGIFRVIKALRLVQEISLINEEFQIKKMSTAFSNALIGHDKSKEPELDISFRDISLPIRTKINTNLTINFRVKLTNGSYVEDVYVWFYVPDGFVLIKPSENESWRQGADFTIPNIRTVKVHMGKVSIGPYTPGNINLQTPSVCGEYILIYKIFGTGYQTKDREEIKIIVE